MLEINLNLYRDIYWFIFIFEVNLIWLYKKYEKYKKMICYIMVVQVT